MPLGLDQGVGAVVWSPLGWGRLTGKIRRGQPLPDDEPAACDRRHYGPQVDDERLYRVVDALDAVAGGGRQDRSAGGAELAAAAADGSTVSSGRATRSSSRTISARWDGASTPNRSQGSTRRALSLRLIPTGTRPSSRSATRNRFSGALGPRLEHDAPGR